MKITCAAIALLTGLLVLAPASMWAAHDGDTSATCADANGDDVSGLTSVPVGLQNEATGERLAHLVLPRGGSESRH